MHMEDIPTEGTLEGCHSMLVVTHLLYQGKHMYGKNKQLFLGQYLPQSLLVRRYLPYNKKK